jgi:integrase
MVRGFKGSALYSIVAVAAYTGMRLREVMALQWIDISFEQKTLTISRAVEETKKHGRKTKDPKTERGKRTIELGAVLVELLASERERHLHLVAGIPAGASVDLSLVKLPAGALVFPGGNGTDLTKLRAGRATSRLGSASSASLRCGSMISAAAMRRYLALTVWSCGWPRFWPAAGWALSKPTMRSPFGPCSVSE